MYIENDGGWISKVQGTTELGFIVKEGKGAENIYFSDTGYVKPNRLAFFGAHWKDTKEAGIFHLQINTGDSSSSDSVGSRLMYL